MALRVPEQDIAVIKRLLELSDDQIAEFLNSLAQAGQNFNIFDLSAEISSKVKLPNDLILSVIKMLAGIYVTRDARNAPLRPFVDQEILLSIKNAKVFSPENSETQWAKLQKFFITALSLENTLGTAAKAGYVLTQHERIFDGARIMTDVRPIFHFDVAEKPESAVIIHMLRITQRDQYRKFQDQYFALDSNDIRNLKAVIERALKKEETLKGLMQKSGVTVLNPKEIF